MRQMIEEPPLAASPGTRARQSLGYLCIVLPLAFLLVTFLHLRILPVFQKILSEFGLREPDAMRWSLTLAEWFLRYWWLGALGVLALAWTVFSTRAGRFVRYSLLHRLVQPLRDLPAADVLQNLGVALRAGRPVPGALSTLARYHFDPDVRNKLLFVRNEIEQGEDVWRSLTNVGMLTPAEVRLLDAAERVGNRPWALQQVVGVKKRRTSRRFEWLAEWLLPMLVVLLGWFVFLQALAVFQPLVTMLEALS